jgi:cytoskeleton protein RodZ
MIENKGRTGDSLLTRIVGRVIVKLEPWARYCDRLKMSNFGEDLRMERLSRGVALEDITAVTKISQHHLVALEQERFRLLPGGILSKGIVRGYTGALGLDQHDWTERFLKACSASGFTVDNDSGWTAFASNVGRSRMLRRDAAEMRMRWAGAFILLLLVAVAAFFTVRYVGVREGRWNTLLPAHQSALIHGAGASVHSLIARAAATRDR